MQEVIQNNKPQIEGIEKKHLLGIIAAIIIYLIFQYIVPVPEGLERPAIASVGILIACILLWVTEALPLSITVVLILVMLPIAEVTPLKNVYTSFMTPVIFFCLVSYGISAALTATPIPYRIAQKLLSWSGTNSKKVVLGFVACSAILSSVMSNIAATAIFMGLALTILKANGDPKPGTSGLGKALMLGIPAGAQIGGIATPVGNSLNILGLLIVQEATGVRVTFLDWMIIGIPVAVIGVIFLAWWLCFFFKPEKIDDIAIDKVKKEVSGYGKIQTREKKVLLWLFIMFVFWLASTWVSSLNLIVIGLVGLIIAFLPGINLMDGKEFMSSISWDVLLMIGGVQALAMGIINTGAAKWMVDLTMSGAGSWPLIVTLLIMSTVVAFLHIIIPTGPPVLALALPPLVVVAQIAGVDPATLVLLVATFAGIELVFPLDSIPLITYGTGYYSMSDMAKYGVPPTIVLIILTSTVVPFLAGMLGY